MRETCYVVGIVLLDRMYKKGDFEAAVVSYKTSLSFCPLGDEYNKDRVCTGRHHDL